jgi:hypothetical protein
VEGCVRASSAALGREPVEWGRESSAGLRTWLPVVAWGGCRFFAGGR